MSETHYVIRVLDSPVAIDGGKWNDLLRAQPTASPFMRHEYLSALHRSGCAVAATGWQPLFFTLWESTAEDETATLHAACALYLKAHSRGEYVFDWGWADAYARHGLNYYPKALAAIPFTPVPGSRLMARSESARTALLSAIVKTCQTRNIPSLHLLFVDDADEKTCADHGLMLRQGVQFHWNQQSWIHFDHFLSALSQDKRKKIRQERRRVHDAGVTVRWAQGRGISPQDWNFFYRCYERTYLEHGNPPYLNAAFFQAMAQTMPDNWLMFIAERQGQPIASSLIGLSADESVSRVAYGRYWGAVQRVDCLHFELCYYQPLQWCIEHGVQRFEGGAQGEHKMARALLPVKTCSAHWIADPQFAQAVQVFLQREAQGIDAYVGELALHCPMRRIEADC